MSDYVRELLARLSALSPEERADVAHYLIHSLDEGEPETDVSSVWKEELRRRWKEIESGAVTGEPADKVFAELREGH